MAEQDGWEVKNERPEETCACPADYYTKEMIEKYSKGSSMKRTQRKITQRLLELLNPPAGGNVLDLGCAWGYSGEYLIEQGYDVTGIDVVDDFIDESKKRGVNAIKADMRELKNVFGENSFDVVVSISALQWLKEKEDIRKVGQGLYHVLKQNCAAGIQFYPKSEEEMKMVSATFAECGFSGSVVVDNPANARKRLVFIILRK